MTKKSRNTWAEANLSLAPLPNDLFLRNPPTMLSLFRHDQQVSILIVGDIEKDPNSYRLQSTDRTTH